MKVIIPSTTRTAIGGGMSFVENIVKGAEGLFRVNHGLHDCGNVVLIPAPTLVTRDDFKRFKKKCPIVLRIDGIPENWRNRGTGWPRLRDYAKWADVVVYQSEFVRDTVGKILGRDEDVHKLMDDVVIYNGVDTSIFKYTKEHMDRTISNKILYVHYRNDPNKRVDEVITRFRMYKLDHPDAKITFVGQYPKNQFHWNGKNDFGMLDWEEGKDWEYIGVVRDKKQMAQIMNDHDFIAFPSFADPCPNTLIEAKCCGLKSIWINEYGGSDEIDWGMKKVIRGTGKGTSIVEEEIDWSLKRMAEEYYAVFKKLIIK